MKNILIVDDDATVANVLRELLASLGVKSADVRTPADIGPAFARGKYDAVMYGVPLNEETTVPEFIAAINERVGDKSVKVLLYSSLTDPATTLNATTAGAIGWLSKPIRRRSLEAVLQKANLIE